MDINVSTDDVAPCSTYDNSNPPQLRCDCGVKWGHTRLDQCIAYLHNRLAKLEKMLNVERED